MKAFTLIIFLFFLSSCSRSQILLEELVLKENIYFQKGTSMPYDGEAISKFDNGRISNKISIKNGIPEGPWTAYGFDGEVVQCGKYVPFKNKELTVNGVKSIRRLNVCEVKEGQNSYTDIFVVVADQLKVPNNPKELKNTLIKLLKMKGYNFENKQVNQVKLVAGELEFQ
ncbi:toxin-antitoxin system YwqK family antitoxin [Pararcticibacter amylolyticus]|uniref:Uncharacterized protein n=1 Tax=Pararcticibacter amylolyticus TaxID=2173175 RepID=A0A2U2P998_9SPHI|nr:hypothetical protein [Pararcticibacter amylolyticus]PWG77915.1 hypothetical protein DDR33_24995 [Pararcticibacter amylolyticus]